MARGKTGSVIGSLVAALAICKGLPESYNRDLQEVTPHLWRGMDWTRSTVRILDGCISSLKFDTQGKWSKVRVMAFPLPQNWLTLWSEITGMPFRTAHSIVGRIAAAGERPSLADLDAIALEVAGYKPSERGFLLTDLEKALDPKSNVRLRANVGGPAPAETSRMLLHRHKMLVHHSQLVLKWQSKVTKALQDC